MRDLEVIDCELRLLLAIRKMAREADGRSPEYGADRRAVRRALGNSGLEHHGWPCIGEMTRQLSGPSLRWRAFP